jgi:CheY-like chemotaxis protein
MNKKVLLVDNSKVCLEIEQELLRRLPVKIFYTTDGKQALEQARKLRPDLVCMELDLPGLDGAACCAAIKEDPMLSGTKVVLMAPPVEEKTTACRVVGCDAIIKKPLERREFISVTRTMLAVNDRIEERIPCRATVSCRLEKAVFCGTLEDVSPRGMFIGSRYEVKVGERLSLRFVLPVSGAGTIETAARVIWTNAERGRRNIQLPVGFGVEFEDLGEIEAGQIAEFIDRSVLWDKMPGEW